MMNNNHSFFKFMHDIIESGIWAKLSSSARTLYPVLCKFTNESFKPVWPGTDELLRLTGFKTKRSLQLAKKELVDCGLIDISYGSGRTNSRYYFRFDYPNNNIDIDGYRDKIVSLRGSGGYTPGGYESDTTRDNSVSPNKINININTNNKQQEIFYKNIEELVKTFVQNLPHNTQQHYKDQVIQTMLNKYGKLEIGEAIKIAIKRGKNGDVNYLEGILRNRNKSNSQDNQSPANDILSLLPENLSIYSKKLEFFYKTGNTYYFKTFSQIPVDVLESYFENSLKKIKIIQCEEHDNNVRKMNLV